MPRNNKRRRNNNNNNNRKKVKQLNNDGYGVTIGGQPNNVLVAKEKQRNELVANETEMGSDNSKIDCIDVLAKDSDVKSENKNELSEKENIIGNDEPNMSNETELFGRENEKCDDQNDVINQSNDGSVNSCHNNNTGLIDSNRQSDNLECKQNLSGETIVDSIQQLKSANKSIIPKAVIANCFTYDSRTETPPPHVTNNDDHENAQINFNENGFGSAHNDTSTHEDNKLSDLDKKVEPLAMNDKIVFSPIMQELANHSNYRVDSPSSMISEKPKLNGVKKSRSMDDNELMIQELSDTGSIGDNENTPIVSEAESEVESEAHIQVSPSVTGILVNVQTIPFSGPLVDLSKEEEDLLNNLINDPKMVGSDTKIHKLRKRVAMETHFMPQFLNPKFLDVIKEENSDTSDVECKKIVSKKQGNSFEDELDDDVFIDSSSIVSKTNAVFPKINLNFSGRRKHISHLKSPSAEVIREEPQCFLVDTKIVDPESVEESCSKWTTSVVKEDSTAELVYIGSSSSSASDVNDQDSVGEADIEDSCDDDSDVRIKTPIIGCDEPSFSLICGGFKSLSPEIAKSIVANDMPVMSNYERQNDEKGSCDNSVLKEAEKKINKICDFETNSKDTNDQALQFKIGAPCSNNMFPISPENPSALNDLQRNEFIRQDSSGSICSSHSHSTSQSQSTARFCAASPSRDIADFENIHYSGASSLTSSFLQPIKTLRQIALETLVSMPYGAEILKELAIVAESLSNLTNQPKELTPPPIPLKPHSYIEASPPPIPPKPLQNRLETPPPIPPKPLTTPPPVPPQPYTIPPPIPPQPLTIPPPIPPKPLNMPYPLPDVPFIDDLELYARVNSNNSNKQFINIVQLPPTSQPKVSIPNEIGSKSWLGMPTEQDPSVLVCLSPSQRNLIKDNKNPNEINPDLLLEMHNSFVKRRGYHEYTDIELKELDREKHLLNDDRHNEMVAKKDDNNRLLAIIRDSKQSTGENTTAHNVKCYSTFEHNNQSGDKMSTLLSGDGQLKMNKPNNEQSGLDNRAMTQPVRAYSNKEDFLYETKKRIENGNVVFEFSNSSRKKSTNNGDKECINEMNINGDLTKSTISSDVNLEKNSVSNTNNKIPSSPINNSAGNTENAKLNEKSSNQEQRSMKAKSEYFDNKVTFKEFDYIPKFFDDCFHTEDRKNDFFNSYISNQEQFFEESLNREENLYTSTTASSRPESSFSDWLKEIDETNNSLDNIVKPIVKEENLCKGMGTRVNVRAPRIHVAENSNEINEKFDEAQRRYEMYVTKQNHMYNRQSMIDQTPITPHVTPQRRKSLPKELQQKQLEYIRRKEQELNNEFDKLEHDRMRLLQEIEEMKVNQHVHDFVLAHKSNSNSSNFISRNQSEAELLRQQMHDEWLNKVAEREERRLQKIIKITRPGEENPLPEQKTSKSSADMEYEFLNRVKERRTKLKMPSDSDWESGAESQPTEREKKDDKVDPKIKVIEGEREADLQELPKHIKEFASDFTTTIEQTDTSMKKITESNCQYEMTTSATSNNDEKQPVMFAPKFKATAPSKGIWSPGIRTEAPATLNRQNSSTSQPPTPPPPPFWSPKSADPSPTFDRKEFRPVKFESPQLGRKVYTKQEPSVQSPWSYPLPDKIVPPRNPPNSSANYFSPYSSNVSKSLNTISLLQKAKKDQLPNCGITNYMPTERKQIPQNHSPGIIRPNEVFYPVKNEYLSEQESENERPKKMEDLGHKKIEGIGPTTKQGMPIVLRSEVDENNHHKWYKRMYNTLHKVHQDGRYPYKTSGYLSEPEPNYDSDYSIYKYSTLDRRRNPTTINSQNITTDEKFYGTMPIPIKCGSGIYKNQPGKIENYVPGHSSVSDKERKEWWDQVMEIFDGRTEHEKLAKRSYTDGYLSRALKDQGYESDSTLVFRKRDNNQPSPLSPVEQKQAYLNLQAGGEAPVQGFRKQAPEKPKDDQRIQYFPITPTLTKIRVNNLDSILKSQQEIICYPITNISRPIDLFGPFPKSVQSFVPVTPPTPPNRKSSKRNTTLQIYNDIQTIAKQNSKKSFGSNINSGTITLRKSRLSADSNRSRSAGSVVSTYSLKEEKNVTNDLRSTRRKFCRVSSVSPISKPEVRKSSASPIAFGRSISKERTFAEEKKKFEQRLPLCRKSFTASTSILRNPDLKSPDQIKKAVQGTFKMPTSSEKYTATKSSRKVSTGGTVKTSDLAFSSNKSLKGATKNDAKSLRVTVAISSKGNELLRTDGRPETRIQNPVVLKSNISRGYRSCENKMSIKSKNSSKSISNLSLARTSSTYSIDSCSSKKRSYNGKSLNFIKSSSKESVFPFTISGKSRKKKPNSKERVEDMGTDEIDHKCLDVVTYNSLTRQDEKNLDEQFHESIDEAIRNNRTDNFFQNLFLRDYPSPPPSVVNCVSKNTSVQEKARLWDTRPKKSDSKSMHQSVYLTNKRAVSDSKFKSMEHERSRHSRSLSPQKLFRPKSLFYDSVTKYDSFNQLSDEEEDFGIMTQKRTTELTYKYEQQPSNIFLTEVVSPNSPVVIHGKQSIDYKSRSISPVRDIRSPSCRRIQSFKASQRADPKKIIRARSLGSSDRYHSLDSHVLRSCSSTSNANTYENHAPMCSHQKSERFQELNKFYNNVERVGQLERATSSTDLHPIRREGELIDFDEWKQCRIHVKAEKELNHLVDKLRRDEKEKDFLFRPKYVEDMKWSERRDSGLRTKEKSVEDLKDIFIEKSQEVEHDCLKKQEIEATKDTYRPLWRGNSVLDLASSMVVKYNTPAKTSSSKIDSNDSRIGLSKKLISTLSRDQIAKIKNQLSEIYNNNFSASTQQEKNAHTPDKFVINVSSHDQPKNGSLIVRSSSLVRKEDLLGPLLRRHQERLMENIKAESISSIHEPRASRSVERYEDLIKRERKEMSEAEKKSIFSSISKEIRDKLLERRQKSMTPIVLAKETRGAIASNMARNTMSTQKTYNPLVNSESNSFCQEFQKDAAGISDKRDKTFHETKIEKDVASNLAEKQNISETLSKQPIDQSKSTDTIQNKIYYFEKKKEEKPETTIYHAREYSSPDEDEIMKIIEKKMAKRSIKSSGSMSLLGRSSSVSDFKELFGERDPGPARTRTPSPAKTKRSPSPSKIMSNSTSVESVFRSRSVSPHFEQKNYKTYYNIVQTGDVRKMKDKFESLAYKPRRNFIEIPPRRFQSDPDLNKIKRASSPDKITVKTHETGDVSWITHKFEVKNSTSRGRSRVRRVISPIPKVPFKKEDRFMPHIDIISKTASLKQEMKKSPTSSQVTKLWTGEVQKMRSKFESPNRLSLLGQMYTSSPDISELKDISSYLTGPWIAHKYPNARDNARSPVAPDKGPINSMCKKRVSSRPCSTSPPRAKSGISSILKPFYDMFANQDFDPLKHRPINRYVPDKRVEAELLWRRLQKTNGVKPTVKFEDTEVVPPPPPLKGVPLNVDSRDPESPHRYVESDVNIHYKTPVRFEYKDPLPESELIFRQAEQMKKLYQEERRRKYIQELQDMSNRRHTDNFTPSQKSPIALNRYDDFGPDISPKSPILPRTVARALYNFQGQSARELSFKKGDILYIRREIDKNWYEGEHNASVGLLPSNYVELISKDGIRVAQKKSPEGQARAKFSFHAQSAIELSLNKGELVTLTRRVDDNWFEGRIANRKGIFPVSYVDVLTDIGADLTPIISSKPIGSPAAHSLTLAPSPDYQTIRPNYVTDLSTGIVPTSNGNLHNGVVRESKTIQKTEVLHVDTSSEPVAYRAIYKYQPQNSDELELQEGDIVYVLEKCDDGWFVGTSQRTGYFGTFPGNYVERN